MKVRSQFQQFAVLVTGLLRSIPGTRAEVEGTVSSLKGLSRRMVALAAARAGKFSLGVGMVLSQVAQEMQNRPSSATEVAAATNGVNPKEYHHADRVSGNFPGAEEAAG